MLPRSLPAVTLIASLVLFTAGCSHDDFPPQKAQALVSARPIHLDAEQVTMTMEQVHCGVEQELWDPPAESGERTVARLTPAARALHFDDDVVVNEAGHSKPYVQVRGDFPASLADPAIHDDGQFGKRVEGKVLVKIDNQCFKEPLQLMGVHKGQFRDDMLPVLHFSSDGQNWQFDGIQH